MDNRTILNALKMMSIFMGMLGEKFRALAYENAIESLAGIENIETLTKQGTLTELEGVGSTIEKKVIELINTGKIKQLEQLKKKYPIDILSLIKLDGVGPKTIFRLYDELGVVDLTTLRQVCEEGKIAQLSRMGEKTQTNILKSLKSI